MKAIKLTEEQQNKLLEMCRVLFPEYRWYLGKFLRAYIIGNDPDLYKEDKSDIKIHWFELCITHLRTKLNLHHDDMYLTTNPGIDTFKHTVDYLYEEFKKLNYGKNT